MEIHIYLRDGRRTVIIKVYVTKCHSGIWVNCLGKYSFN